MKEQLKFGGISMQNGFIAPEGHKGFLAKKLFDEMGKIQ